MITDFISDLAQAESIFFFEAVSIWLEFKLGSEKRWLWFSTRSNMCSKLQVCFLGLHFQFTNISPRWSGLIIRPTISVQPGAYEGFCLGGGAQKNFGVLPSWQQYAPPPLKTPFLKKY